MTSSNIQLQQQQQATTIGKTTRDFLIGTRSIVVAVGV